MKSMQRGGPNSMGDKLDIIQERLLSSFKIPFFIHDQMELALYQFANSSYIVPGDDDTIAYHQLAIDERRR